MELLDFVGLGERLGVKPRTARAYHDRAKRRRLEGRAGPNDLPQPWTVVHGLPVWKASTIDKWISKRPGAIGDRYRQNGEQQ